MEKGRSFQKHRPTIGGGGGGGVLIFFFFFFYKKQRVLKFHAPVVDQVCASLMMLKATSNKPIYLNGSLSYLI